MSYAIITLGGKQYRVHEGERLLVDRVAAAEGATLTPRVLLVGGNGSPDLSPSATVTARVVGHELGEKIRIGKYRKRTGYKRHTGYRSRLTRIEIESIGAAGRKPAAKAEAAPKAEAPAPKAEAAATPAPAPQAEVPAKAEKAQTEPPAKTEAPAKAEAPARTAHPPKGYEDLTVAQIAEAASGWRRPNLEAALEYEREHANRKGAIAALEHALAAKEEGH
jgi:large subunit ribosomal protein L21